MLPSKSSSPYRFRPRRHDVGAALMRKFRHKGVAVSGEADKLRLRVVDALHALMLTMICLTAAVVMDDHTESRLSEFLSGRPRPAGEIAAAPVVDRIAPPEPASMFVRLSNIEDESDAILQFHRPPQHRVAGEEQPAATSAADQPLRAAASSLGQAIHR